MEDTSDLEKTLEYRPAASVRPVSVAVSALAAAGGARRPGRMLQSGAVAVGVLTGFVFVAALIVHFGVASPAPSPRSASFARESPRVLSSPGAAAVVPGAPSPVTASPEVPTVDVASLPRPPIGTIIGAPKHRLWIDGHLVSGWKRTVKCGTHEVQVGSQGEERTVNVPCGGEINVAP
jgi:hypothetical protein